MNHPPRESEATFAISDPDPRAVVRRLRNLKEIAGYRLVAREAQRITDTYLDTRDGQLDVRRAALRIRTVAGAEARTLITFKGNSVAKGNYQKERTEIELPWSAANAHAIVDELRRMGIALDSSSPTPVVPDDAEDFAAALGLAITQRRMTDREPLDVLELSDDSAHVVAEVAVDRVTYGEAPAEVSLYEVEIEAKANGGSAVNEIASRLLADFGQVLRPWRHSKLATGKAIELLRRRSSWPQGLCVIDARALDDIDRVLERNAP